MKSLWVLFILFSLNIFAQEYDLKHHVWQLDEINIGGDSFSPPNNEEVQGVFLDILDSSSDDGGYFTSTICNFLFGNIMIEENEFTFTSNSNSNLECQLDENNSFDNAYFQNFYLNNIDSPFQYSFYEENNWLHLTITNINSDTANYSTYLNNTLTQNIWTLEYVVVNNQDYFPPTELQNNIELYFPIEYNYKNIQTEACDNLNGSVHVSDSTITMVDGGHSFLICDPPIEDFDNIYMNNFMIHLLDNPFTYGITNDSNYLYLTLTDHLGNQAFYYTENMSVKDYQNLDIQIYPNPVTDVLYLKNLTFGKVLINVYNASGQIVNSKSVNSKNELLKIHVPYLKNGIYFISVYEQKSKELIFTEKFIKR